MSQVLALHQWLPVYLPVLLFPLPPPPKVPCRPGMCKPCLPITPLHPHPDSYGAAFPMRSFPWWGSGWNWSNCEKLKCSSEMQ